MSTMDPRRLRVAGCLTTMACCLWLLGATVARAQNCDWDPRVPSKITETCGMLGIGTATPALTLDVQGANTIRGVRTFSNWLGGQPQAGLTLDAKLTTVGQQLADGFGLCLLFQLEDSDTAATNIARLGAVRDGGDAAGNPYGKLTIRLNSSAGEQDRLVVSNTGVTAVGVPLTATYADLAEWASVKGSVSPGTVVIVRREGRNELMPSQTAYDTRVAGVVSAKPGIVLGEEGHGKATVATTGRVKVKVDANAGAIEVGDLLVTSNREGFAMRSDPIDVAGIKMHRPGTLIGKALEPLEAGEGEILVLLSLQ